MDTKKFEVLLVTSILGLILEFINEPYAGFGISSQKKVTKSQIVNYTERYLQKGRKTVEIYQKVFRLLKHRCNKMDSQMSASDVKMPRLRISENDHGQSVLVVNSPTGYQAIAALPDLTSFDWLVVIAGPDDDPQKGVWLPLKKSSFTPKQTGEKESFTPKRTIVIYE